MPRTDVVADLRDGNEQTIRHVVTIHTPVLLNVALSAVRSRAVAEEVVQETWLAALDGLDRFEERSSLRTWLVGICIRQAQRAQERERRSAPFSAVSARDESGLEEWFDEAGGWSSVAVRWDGMPQERLEAGELDQVIRNAVRALPEAQRNVLLARDVAGLTGPEAELALALSGVNQRKLLSRGRSAVCDAVNTYTRDADLAGSGEDPS